MTVTPETDVRSRILLAATRLFGQRGFGATSVREVVDAAGVTKPTLYYWFENKDALFVQCVQAKVEELRAIVQESFSGPGPLASRLERFVDRYIDRALADEDGVRLMMTVQHPVDDGQPEVDLFSVQTENIVAITEVIDAGRGDGSVRPDVDPVLVALSLLGSANMHVLAALHGMPLPDDLAARIVRHFLHGVAP